MKLKSDETIVKRLASFYYVVKHPKTNLYLTSDNEWADRGSAYCYRTNAVFTHAEEYGGITVMVREL